MAKHKQYAQESEDSAAHDTTMGEQYFAAAVKTIQTRSKILNLPHKNGSIFLETLFPESPLPKFPGLQPLAFTGSFSEQTALYQVGQMAAMLRERLAVPLGFADPGVILFDICHGNSRYTHGVLDKIAFCIANQLGNDGADAFVDLIANRFYGLDRNGLAKVDMPKAELVELYARQADWHRENRRILGIKGQHGYNRLSSYTPGARSGRVAVVLGCLPPADEYDAAIAACVQRLLPEQAPSTMHDNDAISADAPRTTGHDVLDSPVSRAYMLSPEEYWRHYKDFLTTGPTSPAKDSFVPPPPGEYRKLLDARQALRDARLQLLGPYTGLHRKNATEQDLLAAPYPLFFRLAEEVVRQVGAGIVSFVSPSDNLSEGSAEKMRRQMCENFHFITITEMRGLDERENSVTGLPLGKTIDLAVSTMVKTVGRTNAKGGKSAAEVWYLDNQHGAELNLAGLMRAPAVADLPVGPKAVLPSARNAYAFRPPAMSAEYLSWPSTAGIYNVRINGVMEKRGGVFFDSDRNILVKRMRAYFDAGVSWDEYNHIRFGTKRSRIDDRKIREAARRKEGYADGEIRPYLLKPFDVRWCYYTATRPIWFEPRPELAALQKAGNHFLVVRSNQAVDDEGVPFFFTDLLGDSDMLRGHAYYVPAWFNDVDGRRTANLSETIQNYFDSLGVMKDTSAESVALQVHHHILAVGFAPAYLHENQVELGQEWPRIPFPGFDPADPRTCTEAREAFGNSTGLGRRVAALLTGDSPLYNANPRMNGDGIDDFVVLMDERSGYRHWEGNSIVVDREWGKIFREGAVLPSHGKLSIREYTSDERRLVETTARTMGVHAGAAYALLGETTRDIYLNERVYLQNVPAKVWDFTVGGYQVLKKWLSYRERDIVGRSLTFEEVDDFCRIIRRIVRLRLLGFHLNRNYTIVRDMHRKECVGPANC